MSIAVIAGLSTVLALLIIVADALLLNYGECVITINDDEERTVMGGKTLLAALMDEEIFIPSACGGRGSCGLCKVAILEGGGPLLPTETPHLTKEEITGNVRLSCQVKVRTDMRISVPEEILSVREYTAVVESIVDLNYDTKLLRFKLDSDDGLGFVPGQYIQLETPPYGKTPEPVYRAYSIASSPEVRDALEFVIRRVPNGICTTYVFEVMKEGDPVKFNGPYGDFYLRDTDRDIVFIAGGSGISPVRSILYQMARDANPRQAVFFYGANELRDLYLVEEMNEFEKKVPSFSYVPCLARPGDDAEWTGETGLVTEVVNRHVRDASEKEAYLCGSPGMIDACIEVLREKDMPGDRIYYDKFA